MNSITEEQREQAFETANSTQQSLYDDHDSALRIGAMVTKYDLSHVRIEFVIAIGDVILGLVPQEKLPDLLIERLQITRPEAMRVTADVLDFLAPLSNPTAAQATPIAINSQGSTITDNEMLEVEIAQAEAALHHTVQPMRTMAHDMEIAKEAPHAAEPVQQGTSQADLLAGNKVQNQDARWGDTTQ